MGGRRPSGYACVHPLFIREVILVGEELTGKMADFRVVLLTKYDILQHFGW